MFTRTRRMFGTAATAVTVIAGIVAFPFVLAGYELRDAVTGAEVSRAEA